MDLHDGDPYWPIRDGLPTVHPPLAADRRCDVAVVGGGITGALIALALVEAGLDVTVLDRRDVGRGSTAASTALLQYEIDELLIDLASTYGLEAARACYRACLRGIELVERATRMVGGPCGFRRTPSVYVAPRPRDATILRAEHAARAAAGFAVEWLDAAALRARWGLVGHGAIVSSAGGAVDPYALTHAGLATVRARGGAVFDRTAVVGWEPGARGIRLRTDRGATVSARWCIVATGYEVRDLLPELRVALRTTFAFVSEPVVDLAARYPGGLMFWERADPYLYGRSTDDGRVLVGGRDEAYRDPVRRRRALPSKLRALHAAAARRLPDVPLEVGYGWAGTFAETPDGLPYIGGHPAAPRCLFALGFGGNGITYSALAAAYLAAALTGAPDPEAALFRLDRPPRRPSAERRRPARAVARATRGRSRRPRRSAGRRVARPSLRGPGWRAACAS